MPSNPAVAALLVVHVCAGSAGLLSGGVALASKKGSRIHRRFGRIYFLAMGAVAATAFVLAPVFHNVFLFLVAVLSYYAAFAGVRALRRKDPRTAPAPADWAASLAVAVSGTVMIVLGVVHPPYVEGAFVPMFLVFGGISVALGLNHLRTYVQPPAAKNAWLVAHVGGMVGSYIAALTAFSATNLHVLPLLVRWFWPTVLLVPVIAYFSHAYGSPQPKRATS